MDTILPKLMELLKTMKVPTEICDKIEGLIKGWAWEEESPEEEASESSDEESTEDTEGSCDTCKCPECGYQMKPSDMKPMDSKKWMPKKVVAVDVTVIKDKKNPLKDLLARSSM